MQDARQLLADGRFVSQLADGQAITVSGQLAEQLNVQVQEDVEMEEPATTTAPTTETDAEAIVKALEVSLSSSRIFISKNELVFTL